MENASQRLKCALCSFTGSAYELGVHLIKNHNVDPKIAILGIKEVSKKLSIDVRPDVKRLVAEFLGLKSEEVAEEGRGKELVELAPPTPTEAPRGFDLRALYKLLDERAIDALRQIRLDGGWDSFVPLEDESKYTPPLIERLKQADLIEWSIGDRALRCPRCLSRNIRVFYVCPYCKSRDVSKDTLHTHHSCGAFFTRPIVRGKSMYCPNCGAELKEGDYSVVGAWFKCESCDRGFENPDIGFKCDSCMLDFDIQASRYDKVLSAKLTDKAKLFLTALDILDSVSREASSRGYEVRLFSTIRGVSGVEHDFEVVLVKGDRLVAVAVLLPTRNEPIFYSIAPILAKAYDLPENAWLLVTCKMQLDADVQRLLSRYRLKLAQGSSMEEVSASIARCLDDLEGLRVA